MSGAKVITIAPDESVGPGRPRVQGSYVLFDEAMAPRAVIDGPSLTELRTAATTLAAISAARRPTAEPTAVFGAGPQARGHCIALSRAGHSSRFAIGSRSESSTARLVAELTDLGIEARPIDAHLLAESRMVLCATTSASPLYSRSDAPRAELEVSIGTHSPRERELSGDVFAGRTVIVESRAAAYAENGNLLAAEREGIASADAVLTLAELARRERGPSGPLVVLNSGAGWEDLIVATTVVDALERKDR